MANQEMCCGNSPFFGCRFSLYPMTDSFVPVILDAIEELKKPGLEVESDDVSTFVSGLEENVFAALRDTLAKAAASGKHVVMTTTFSKGCPGEGFVDISKYRVQEQTDFERNKNVNHLVTCQFSMYPLGAVDYMSTIYQIVQATKDQGLFAGSQHFCTRISGSIEQVFHLLEEAFRLTAAIASHVVMVATLSCNSPSTAKEEV